MKALQKQEEHWRAQVAAAPARLDLPLGPGRAGRPLRAAVPLAASHGAALEATARRAGVSIEAAWLALWATFMAGMADADAVQVARIQARTDASMPLQPLVLRFGGGEGEGGEPVGTAARALADADAHAMPQAAFDALFPELPVWQLGFHFGDPDDPDSAAWVARCDLACVVGSGEGTPACELVVSADADDVAMPARWAALFATWLEQALDTPQMAWRALPLMAPEAAQALCRRGHVARDVPDCTVHALFEAQVDRTPDATAVAGDTHALTYRSLDEAANRLARQLRLLGAGPDARVAVFLDRTPDLLVAVLAILKAGAAYVPLDPGYPPERLRLTLGDSAPTAVISGTAMAEGWAGLADAANGVPVLRLDDPAAPWIALPATRIDAGETGVSPAHLAYVLYTSGSTGTPKGVAMPHAPLVNLIQWQTRQPGHEGPLRTLQFAALGFDVAFQEMFATLCTGGELHMIDADSRLSGERLHAFVRARRIERLFLPYFALQMLAEAHANAGEDPQGFALREVVTAGEPLRIEPRIRAFFDALPECRLHNHYGPTESHVVTAFALEGAPADWPLLPSIGRPIDNARVYLLDRRGQPVVDGMVGELYLAGPVLARGYLGRDELSAERFLDDPFDNDPAARMYRTGDLARWRADGALEFLGRRDFQVKIRGFRVELGEVEAQVMACDGVREAGVTVREDVPGLKRLVAYFTPIDPERPVDIDAMRTRLANRLPEHMVPAAYVPLPAMPLSPNGKLDRGKLPSPGQARPDWIGEFHPPVGEVESQLCALFSEALGLEGLGRHDSFFTLGGTSLLALRLLQAIRKAGLGEVAVTALFAAPTPAGVARVLAGDPATPALRTRARRRGDDDVPIAIIAMTGRFPGANDVESFWENLCEGRDSIRFFTPDELDPSIPLSERDDPDYVAARGVIEGHDCFDAAFFGISPREAELMDPQQRLFLELCWECMERGGHAPGRHEASVGVYAGMYNASYFQKHVSAHPDRIERLGAFQVMLDNEKDYIATRVAHKLDLDGPAISVHTACSTSLVAIAQAVDSLRAGRCDMALAGGVSITCPPNSGYRYQEGAMLSPDGHTRTFDADAKGTVFGDGAAVVLLRRLDEALADGDPIHAVIRGVALNNDGADKASFTAPSAAAQAAVVAMAHEDAGVDPRSIGYVEAHGTATPLGDPIEVEGLTRAFRRGTRDTGFCRIGSLKSNMGHLLIAAGAAGVIKTALSLEHECIPPTLHYVQPNPAIDFASSPFVVNASATPWPREGTPRRAGVSSFGVGGTNAHVVLEEAPGRAASVRQEGPAVLPVSARTPAALAEVARRLAGHLERHPDTVLEDVAWTLSKGRKAFAHRASVVADDVPAAIAALGDASFLGRIARGRPARSQQVVLMFPGQGATYPRMGAGLYAADRTCRDALDACASALGDAFGFDLLERLHSEDPDALIPTSIMQPATFALEYALAKWWQGRGLEPVAMIGHSVGEFVAATLAGVFSLEAGIRLVAERGRLMQAQPPGGMLSVRADWGTLASRLPAGVSMAAENAPAACVVAGPSDALSAFQDVLEGEGVACRMLHTSHAFHSAMMVPAVEPFRAAVEAAGPRAPEARIVSTTTGDWLDPERARDPAYWASHLREPVRFSKALLTALEMPGLALLEAGPRGNLSSLARLHPQVGKAHVPVIASLADSPERETSLLHQAFGDLWSCGIALEPSTLDTRTARRRVCLPTYPFERQRYWLDAPPAQRSVLPHPAAAISRENPMPHLAPATDAPAAPTPVADRIPGLVARLRDVIEDVSGIDMADAEADANFIELGLDSLVLTQVALQVQKSFGTRVTFRQLMSDASSLSALAGHLDAQLPPEPVTAPVAAPAAPVAPAAIATVATAPAQASLAPTVPAFQAGAGGDALQQLIAQQMQLMSQQLALLGGQGSMGAMAAPTIAVPAPPSGMAAVSAPAVVAPAAPNEGEAAVAIGASDIDDEAALAHTRYDLKKAFGAIARIDSTGQLVLEDSQRTSLSRFIDRYQARTAKSKAYTRKHRAHMADPRVVNGFRPLTKEICYQIVIERSHGARMWDLDGNEYVDALNGFGMSLFGWQPDFIMDAVRTQLDRGIDIGPQHPLAGEVAGMICELTGHDRAALCNTGSEAVLGALRIARTVTGRETLVVFNGSYHGIIDEVIVRGTRKLKSVPAAPGILRNTAEHVLVLDYGTPEAMQVIRERAHEIAAVLVEPVQSRRPDFRPVEFLRELRQVTAEAGAALIFDEVITGFRAHPGGTQAMFGVKADIATYGKVVGGGQPIGAIAGKREFMDALDGGAWDFGDDSVPTVGVTYFAGTFVRHPMALAAAHAVLVEMKRQGPALQEDLNARMDAMADEINRFCRARGAPVEVRHFASVWKTFFLEDHPLQDLLFAMMRTRGVHILDNFPCFLTTAHGEAERRAIVDAFKASIVELQEAGFLPGTVTSGVPAMDAAAPPVPGARIGRDPEGRPAWYLADPDRPDQYVKVG